MQTPASTPGSDGISSRAPEPSLQASSSVLPPPDNARADALVAAAALLRDQLAGWPGHAPIGPITYFLNPLEYAWRLHEAYLRLATTAQGPLEAVMVGMNPGPWGMAQTGVPFGSPDFVRDFLGLTGSVDVPERVHPKRPIAGLLSPRTEVSGQRLWGGIQACFGDPRRFFERFFIVNYCPLAFQTDSGANITPDKLPRQEASELEALCDEHLANVLRALSPQTVIGVGKWAEQRAQHVVESRGLSCRVASIPHPSPANPAANRGWLEAARRALADIGHPWPPASRPVARLEREED